MLSARVYQHLSGLWPNCSNSNHHLLLRTCISAGSSVDTTLGMCCHSDDDMTRIVGDFLYEGSSNLCLLSFSLEAFHSTVLYTQCMVP